MQDNKLLASIVKCKIHHKCIANSQVIYPSMKRVILRATVAWTAAELRVLSIQEASKVMVSECNIAFECCSYCSYLAVMHNYQHMHHVLLL